MNYTDVKAFETNNTVGEIRNCDTIHIIGRHDMKDAEYKQNIDRIMDDILRRIADDIKERAIKMHNR